ncbi:hypothetical protein Vafri_14231 [Volvox africanus]|uniref:Uncharacterized protein n=1 Tax=Volvox africanus TaxID=51714 RepID=A0A8J4F4G5_9CHLO|nr:hypothetical protein Vafri_14231 [Volvox africanus]
MSHLMVVVIFSTTTTTITATTDATDNSVASGPRSNPFSWDVFGSPMTHMAIQTLAYGSFVVLYDAGVLTRLYVYGKDAAWIAWQWLRRDKRVQREGQPRSSAAPEIRRRGWWVDGWWRRSGQQQHLNININVGGGGGRDAGVGAVNTAAGDMEEGVPLIASAAAEAHGASRYSLNDDGRRALYQEGFHGDHGRYPLYGGGRAVLDSELVEDEDVMEEKRAVIAGLRNNCQVLLDGVRKSYSQGPFRAAVAAVRGLWVGVPAGECFGLLGVNGADREDHHLPNGDGGGAAGRGGRPGGGFQCADAAGGGEEATGILSSVRGSPGSHDGP